MATSTDLAGLGMAAQLAEKLGNQPVTIAGVGTTQSAGATILSKNVQANAQSGATALVLPSNADIGTEYFVSNATVSAASALIFVPSGAYLSNGSNTTLNGAYTLAQNSMVVLFQAAKGYWYSK